MKRTIVTWIIHHLAFAIVGALIVLWLVSRLLGPLLHLAVLAVGFVLGWACARSWGTTKRVIAGRSEQ